MNTQTDQNVGDVESPAQWREHEMLLLQQVMAFVGKSLPRIPCFAKCCT